MNTKLKIFIISVLLIGFGHSVSYGSTSQKSVDTDTVSVVTHKKEKNTFFKTLLKPLKWIGKNWSAYDPRYSTPSFYNWVGQLQNTTSMEMMHLKQDNMMDLVVRSKWSNKIGPYLGYSFLFYGYTIDLNALKGTNRRNEFTLSVNSNLVNIDIIRRRTGGDFLFKRWNIGPDYINMDMLDIFDLKKVQLSEGDMNINNDLTGININYFTNHKKYSNPAAFSNGAIQLRSVGSPILGFGYTYHKVSMPFSNSLSIIGLGLLEDADGNPAISDKEEKTLVDEEGNIIEDNDAFKKNFAEIVSNHADDMRLEDNWFSNNLIFNSFPSYITVSDWHLQLGYAYNLVFSRRLLLGLSAIFSPGIKSIHSHNSDSPGAMIANSTSPEAQQFMKDIGINNTYETRHTNLGFNAYGRASLTYNFNRWRAGFNANVNYSRYRNSGLLVEDGYGSLAVYVGYCFGRKKEYRWDGENREAYIKAALTKYQIEEMRDTMPDGNINKGASYQEQWGKTKYHTDKFNFEIKGCDLVQGPDGTYGSFEIEDGRVTHGNDTEQRLAKGTVLPMDKDGDIDVTAGHNLGFRPSNWLKSQLDVRQLPGNWYPEMLHYSLRGKLTMYLRNYRFGTKKPVKVVIDDFVLSHGRETKGFYLIGAKKFYSHSAYSVIGMANVNDRMFEVYIESKKNGKRNDIYFNPIMKSGLSWMKYIPNTRAISRVSIPGTHDAGTSSLVESTINSMGHTQNFSITEQIVDGVRAFDIRLKKNMKYGHTSICRDGLEETMVDIRRFFKANPSEFLIFMIGSDERGNNWSDEMKANFNKIYKEYADLMIDKFDAQTKVGDVRGKILVIKRQEDCPYGKLLKFEDNTTFTYDCFVVEDEYKMHKTYKKAKLVEQHLRNAYENDDPTKWYITFNSIAWDPRHHKPYYSAWGATNVRKPMNKALRETIEKKGYNDFGIVFLDFYNDHGDNPYPMKNIIQSNFHLDAENDYIPASEMGDR